MARVAYTICYLYHVQILYRDLDNIYHTSYKYPKLLDVITGIIIIIIITNRYYCFIPFALNNMSPGSQL